MRDINISVIIPVYNVEMYLRDNIESLIAIKNQQIEFIYVDDGSPDNSVVILEEYQKKDDRIRIIRRKNGGLSAARNTGIKEAAGEWILFVDGDDYLDPRAAELLFMQIEDGIDIIWGGYENVTEKKKLKIRASNDIKNGICSEVKTGMEWLEERAVNYVPWIYLYSSALLRDNNIAFAVGFLHEDMDFLPRVFYYAKGVKKVPISFYRYVQRERSISHMANYKRSQDMIRIAGRLLKFESKLPAIEEYHLYMREYRGELCCEALHIAILNGGTIQKIFNGMPELKKMAVRYLLESPRKRDRAAGVLLKFGFYRLYELMYRRYDALRRNRLGK